MLYFQKLMAGIPVYWHENLYFYSKIEQSDSLCFEDSWKVSGCYVFTPPNTVPDERLANKIKLYCSNRNNLFLLWVENPTDPVEKWRTQSVDGTGTGDSRKISSQSSIRFDRYSLLFSNASIIRKEDTFFFSGEIIANLPVCGYPPIELICRAGGHTQGILTFSVEVDGNGKDPFQVIGAELRHVFQTKTGNTVKSQTLHCYPLQSNQTLRFQAALDPTKPLDPTRTRFLLPQTIFSSSFYTPEGKPLTLTPQWGASLVFERGTNDSNEWYLSPCGKFALPSDTSRILCGLSGSEFVDLTECPDKILYFEPHREALWKRGTEAPSSEEATSWVRFPDGFRYSSQDVEIPYYCAEGQNKFLKPMQITAARYQGRSPEVPVVLYARSNHTFETVGEIKVLENSLQAFRRYVWMNPLPPAIKLDHGPSTQGATPQGLIADIHTSCGHWKVLDLGVSENDEQKRKSARLPFPSEAVSKSLQGSELFLIYEDVNAFREDFFMGASADDTLEISADKWSFAFHPEVWRNEFEETNTAVIIKYTDQKSIYEAMKDSPILKASLWEAYEEDHVTVKKEYREFVKIVQEPGFQGTLVLNCPLNYARLPSFLQIIVKGIDAAKLYAHHVVLSSSRLSMGENGTLLQMNSSVNALVDFEDGEPIIPDGTPMLCDFTTLKLKLVIHDSSVVLFQSRSELLVNAFFGSFCQRKSTESGNCLVLDGTCHERESGIEYSFSLRETVCFVIPGNTVEEVIIDSVGLSIGKDEEWVFALGGSFAFAPVEGNCDFFCYGQVKEEEKLDGQNSDATEADRRLRFTGLQYIMSEKTVDGKPEKAASINYACVLLSDQSALPRQQSFADRFPCELNGFITGKGDSPDSQNYSAIKSPAVQNALGGEWFGLDWKIDLGTLGGMSSAEGGSLHLLAAWSGDSTGGQSPCYYGAKISSAEADSFGVQGVVKLGFQSIEVRLKQEDPMPQAEETGKESKKFELRLHNFNLRLLGIPIIPGNNDLIIFLDETGGQKRLGWFAAYENEKK